MKSVNQKYYLEKLLEETNKTSLPTSYLSLSLPQTAGSDAHQASEIWFAYALIKAGLDVDGIVRSVERGAAVPIGKPIPWSTRLRNAMSSLRRRGM
jgi:hypothetical protein